MTSRSLGGAASNGSLLAVTWVVTSSPFAVAAEARTGSETGGGQCSVEELPVPDGSTNSWVQAGSSDELPTLGRDSAIAYTLSEQEVAAGQSEDEAGNGRAVVWNGC